MWNRRKASEKDGRKDRKKERKCCIKEKTSVVVNAYDVVCVRWYFAFCTRTDDEWTKRTLKWTNHWCWQQPWFRSAVREDFLLAPAGQALCEEKIGEDHSQRRFFAWRLMDPCLLGLWLRKVWYPMPCGCMVVCVLFSHKGLDRKERKNQVDLSCLDMETIIVVPFILFSTYLLCFLFVSTGIFRSTKKRWKRGHNTIRCETTFVLPSAKDSRFRASIGGSNFTIYEVPPYSRTQGLKWKRMGRVVVGVWVDWVCKADESRTSRWAWMNRTHPQTSKQQSSTLTVMMKMMRMT